MDFIYKFDMSEEIDYFKLMSEPIQISAECNAVDVIYESFVVPGDQDYLMSRLLAQKGLPRGFFWAAAQAIEKYLKAFLVLNGKSVKPFSGGHPIKALFKAASDVDNSLAELIIRPHQCMMFEEEALGHLMTYTTPRFIDELEKHGSADNRYNAFGIEYNTGHLFAMDSLSFQLRSKIGVIPIDESFKSLSGDLIQVFGRNNPWFDVETGQPTNKIHSKDFPVQYSVSVTKLEFLIKNQSQPAYKLALQWLDTKMKLPVTHY